MTTTEIRAKLEYIFICELDVIVDDLTNSATSNDLGMDSASKAIIIAEIERTFEIQISDAEFDALKEFRNYVALVEEKLK